MTRDSNAKPGQEFRTPWGELRTLVSVTSAGLWIEAKVNQEIAEFRGTPAFTRDSIAGRCVLFGSTTGWERREYERARKRNSKPIRKWTEEHTA